MTKSPAEFEVREVVTAQGRSRVLVGGSGPALLYLHGVGDTGTINPLLRHLAERRTVLRPDHPGFLGTDPAGCASVVDVAARHLGLLDALQCAGELHGPTVVVGSSFGGWVAAELALRAPEQVSALVLVDPAGLPTCDPRPDLYALDPVTMVALSFHQPALKAGAKALDDATGEVLHRNLLAARRVAPTMSDPTLAERLASMEPPTTVVWGAEDEIFPASCAETWRLALPGASVEILEGAGHLPHVEQLEEFLACTGLSAR